VVLSLFRASPADDFAAVVSAARAGADWGWLALYETVRPAARRHLRGPRRAADAAVADAIAQVAAVGLERFQGDADDFRRLVIGIATHEQQRVADTAVPRRQETSAATNVVAAPALWRVFVVALAMWAVVAAVAVVLVAAGMSG